jgi:hypothetical protein
LKTHSSATLLFLLGFAADLAVGETAFAAGLAFVGVTAISFFTVASSGFFALPFG